MRRLLLLSPLLIANAELPVVDQDATPIEIPAPIKAMLDAALASGNEGEVATIVKYARSADPISGDVVLAMADKWRADRANARNEKLRSASAFQLWSGRAELGGFLTTGNSNTKGVTGVLDITREGLRWRHKLYLQADYQQSLGVTTREHYFAAYEPNLKLSPRSYLYGSAQFEGDRFLGYDERYSASAGAGYSAIKRPKMTLDLELGPAYRNTAFIDGEVQSSLAVRGKLDFDWKLSPGLTFSQDAATYVERYNSTISSNTALGAKLIGPLSAQLSYNVQYESSPPLGRETTDTISRASLVYTF